MKTARDVIDQQIAAYNRRDIDAFVACYAEEAEVVQTDVSLLASGHSENRGRYGELFEQSPPAR